MMQANWSLMLNLVFLGVILSMIAWRLRPMFKDKFSRKSKSYEFPISKKEDFGDDIIEVRRVDTKDASTHHMPIEEAIAHSEPKSKPSLVASQQQSPILEPMKKNIMLFLAANGQNVFAGYELLQTLLACGLRYGDSGFFHRHQHATGQGPVLFSLAAATPTGMFDLQNMGAMTVKGLCMFMELSGNIAIDNERYEIFMQTAKQLAEELHANLLDERQQMLTADTFVKFEQMISETMDV
jgi:cell division protein ZipA